MDLDLATRQTLGRLVAGLITSDAKIAPKEATFFYRVVAQLGLDASFRETVVPLRDAEAAADVIAAQPPRAQEEALRLLIEAACIDGQVQPQERGYLRAIGAALRISEEDVDRRIVERLIAPR